MVTKNILAGIFVCCIVMNPSGCLEESGIYEAPLDETFSEENLYPAVKYLHRHRRDTDETTFSGDGDTTTETPLSTSQVSENATATDMTTVQTTTPQRATTDKTSVQTTTPQRVRITINCTGADRSYVENQRGIVIQCNVTVKPPRDVLITWTKDGTNISSSGNLTLTTIQTENQTSQYTYNTSLVFTTIYIQHAGNYTVKAEEIKGVVDEEDIYLIVYEEPEVTLTPSNVSLKGNQRKNITCTITNKEAVESVPKLRWCRDGVIITDKTITSRIFNVSLGQEILMLTSDDPQGTYSCGVDDCTATAELRIEVEINGECTETNDSYVDGQGDISVQCMFSVVPSREAVITWSRGGDSILGFDRLKISTCNKYYNTSLTFTTIRRRDRGNYTVKADVKGVTEEVEIYLVVYEKPEVRLTPSVISLQGDQEGNFTCSVTNMNAIETVPVLKWCRGETEITDRSKVVNAGSGREVLMMNSSDTAETYGCGVDNCTARAELKIYKAGDKRCDPSTDNRGISWSTTVANTRVQLSCQTGFVGTVSRYCGTDGVWGNSDYINCVNEKITEAEEKVKSIQEGSAPISDVEDVFNDLAAATENATTRSAGDLDKSIEVVEKLVEVVGAKQSSIDKSTTESFLKAVGSILTADTGEDSQWTQIQQKNSTKAASLMKSVSTFGLAAARSQADNTTWNITNENLVMQLGNNVHGDVAFPREGVAGVEDTFTLPGDNFESNEKITYVAVFYKTITDFLPKNASGPGGSTKEVNSEILSLAVERDGKDVRRLYDNITLDFRNLQSNYSEPACGYWDFVDSQWKTDGCTGKAINETHSTCKCNHLTNFAILMSPGRVISEEDLTYLRIITIVGCSLSILGCVVTVIAHLCLWRYVKSQKSITLIHLCICLTFAYTVFLAGGERTENTAACTAVAALLHYLFLSAFFLMLAQGLEIAIQVVFIFKKGSKLSILLPLAWGIPAIIVGITLGITQLNGYGSDTYCWLTLTDGVLYAFVGPVLFVILINFVIIAVVMRALCSTKMMNTKQKKQKAVAGIRSLCVLMPVLGVTWVFGVLSVNEDTVIFQYLFAAFNTVQGFLIFIFHCILNRAIQNGIRKRKYRYDSQRATKTSSFSRVKSIEEKKHRYEMAEMNMDYSDSNGSQDGSEEFDMRLFRPSSWQQRVAVTMINDVDRLTRINAKNLARATALNNEYLEQMPIPPWYDRIPNNSEVRRLPRVSIKVNDASDKTQIYTGVSNQGRRWHDRSPVEQHGDTSGIYRGYYDDDDEPWRRRVPFFNTHL